MSDSQIASQRFAGRTVIVTGAAQGMGEAIARRLSAEGASLVLVDLLDHVHGVARDCGEHAVGVVGDVASADTVRTAVELARARGGRVWGLANVAGIHHLGDALETEEADWAQVLSINLTAPWLWSRAILPELVAGGGGSIVIITSINGSFARPRSLAYNSSKSGALGLVRSLAIDYGRQGVRTNSLSPGSVETDMLKRLFAASPDARQDHLDKTFAPRLGIPEDIAGACAFLLSDDAAYVNGADLRVDGARTIAI